MKSMNFKKSPIWVAVVGVVLLFLFMVFGPWFNQYEWFDNGKGKGKDKGKATFTMFGAAWCGHCKTAKPKFKALGPTMTIDGVSVTNRFVDVEKDPQDAKGYKIEGYPTFYLDTPKGRVKYDGPRETDSFREFLKSQLK